MVQTVSAPNFPAKPAYSGLPFSAAKTAQPTAPETARASAGETAAANVRAETTLAIEAPEQVTVAPRLRDQETAERTDRGSIDKERPTGPPPAFKESLLERQARKALDSFEIADISSQAVPKDDPEVSLPGVARPGSEGEAKPKSDPRSMASAAFAETRSFSAGRETASVDVAR